MKNNLAKVRHEAGLSLRELAELSGTTTGWIWQIETKLGTPGLGVAYRIGKVLGLSVYELWPDETEVEETITIRRTIKQ